MKILEPNLRKKYFRLFAVFLVIVILLSVLKYSSFVSIPTNVPTKYPADGLIGWWRFDDGAGAIAADSSEIGSTGSLVGSPIWVSGVMAVH